MSFKSLDFQIFTPHPDLVVQPQSNGVQWRVDCMCFASNNESSEISEWYVSTAFIIKAGTLCQKLSVCVCV